jgi:hypothetical protein
MVLGVAPLKSNVGVGCQRGMAHAVLVYDDGRLINADHLSAGRASKMHPHLTSFGPASKAPKRETPQRGPWETTVGEKRRPGQPLDASRAMCGNFRTWPARAGCQNPRGRRNRNERRVMAAAAESLPIGKQARRTPGGDA